TLGVGTLATSTRPLRTASLRGSRAALGRRGLRSTLGRLVRRFAGGASGRGSFGTLRSLTVATALALAALAFGRRPFGAGGDHRQRNAPPGFVDLVDPHVHNVADRHHL